MEPLSVRTTSATVYPGGSSEGTKAGTPVPSSPRTRSWANCSSDLALVVSCQMVVEVVAASLVSPMDTVVRETAADVEVTACGEVVEDRATVEVVTAATVVECAIVVVFPHPARMHDTTTRTARTRMPLRLMTHLSEHEDMSLLPSTSVSWPRRA